MVTTGHWRRQMPGCAPGSRCSWPASRLAIVVVFDEGETTEQVPFVIMAPALSGAVIHRGLNHYALTRLIDQVAGAPLLRHAARAASLVRLLHLRI